MKNIIAIIILLAAIGLPAIPLAGQVKEIMLDASSVSATLEDVLPPGAFAKGKVLITPDRNVQLAFHAAEAKLVVPNGRGAICAVTGFRSGMQSQDHEVVGQRVLTSAAGRVERNGFVVLWDSQGLSVGRAVPYSGMTEQRGYQAVKSKFLKGALKQAAKTLSDAEHDSLYATLDELDELPSALRKFCGVAVKQSRNDSFRQHPAPPPEFNVEQRNPVTPPGWRPHN